MTHGKHRAAIYEAVHEALSTFTKAETAHACGITPVVLRYCMDRNYIDPPTTLVGCEYCYTAEQVVRLQQQFDQWRGIRATHLTGGQLAKQCGVEGKLYRNYTAKGIL